MRVLAVIRQSKKRELSESPEAQRLAIRAWAEANGHSVEAEAIDVGVSASVSPFDRPSLGPWLTDAEKLARWDVLAVWKVDRVVRDTVHWYAELVPEIFKRLGRHCVATSEGINTLTSSELEIALRVALAQEELQKRRDWARTSRERLRVNARWGGAVPWFGYYAVRTPEGTKLVIDEEAAGVVRTALDMLRRDYTLNYVASYLNQEGVLTAQDRHAVRQGRKPKGRPWRRQTLVQTFTSRSLLGQMRRNGAVVRHPDGSPIQFGPPILTRAEWAELQELIRKSPTTRRRRNASPLLRIAYCNDCGRPMYYRPPAGDDRVRRYFCSSRSIPGRASCGAGSFPSEELERVVEALYLSRYGSEEIVTAEAVTTVDYDSKISEIDERIVNLAAGLASIQPGPAHDAVTAELNKAQAEREELATAAKARQGVRYTRTGRTYGQEWAEADESGRLDLLRKHNVYVMVQRARGDLPHYIGIGMGYRDWSYSAITW